MAERPRFIMYKESEGVVPLQPESSHVSQGRTRALSQDRTRANFQNRKADRGVGTLLAGMLTFFLDAQSRVLSSFRHDNTDRAVGPVSAGMLTFI